MEGRVLVVEPIRLVREAIRALLEYHGYGTSTAATGREAQTLPRQFDCAIFSDRLPDANAISLAGWLLAERRIRCAIFFGVTKDVEFRLRASNLGSYVERLEGLPRLLNTVRESTPLVTRRSATAVSERSVAQRPFIATRVPKRIA